MPNPTATMISSAAVITLPRRQIRRMPRLAVGGSDLIVSMYFKAPLGNTPVEVTANVLDARYFSGVTQGPPPAFPEIPEGNVTFDDVVVTSDVIYTIPEPATIGLVLMGIVGLVRRK